MSSSKDSANEYIRTSPTKGEITNKRRQPISMSTPEESEAIRIRSEELEFKKTRYTNAYKS